MVDNVFTLVFLVELLVNMAGNLVSKFFSSSWNVFDFVIVTISVISLGPFQMSWIKGVRILRVFRVLRIFGRIASLRALINALAASIGPVMSAMFMCMCVMCIYAIFGVHAFGIQHELYFKTFARAMFTLFQLATLDSWSGLARSMMDGNSDALRLQIAMFFVSFICIEVFILLPGQNIFYKKRTLSVIRIYPHKHTHTHTHTRTHAHTRTHTHSHTRTCARAHTTVVVAVLLENFSAATQRFREQEEKTRLREARDVTMYMMDPLLESLMSHTSDQV